MANGGSKHISHILEKAPERRDIRAYFRRKGERKREKESNMELRRTYWPAFRFAFSPCIIPRFRKIYLPAKRKRVKLLREDFTAV